MKSQNDIEPIIEITDHAYDRANERLSLNKKSFKRLSEKAFQLGIHHSDTKAHLKKYLDKLWLAHKKANNVRLYGENIFFFRKEDEKNILITVYQLPQDLRKYLYINNEK